MDRVSMYSPNAINYKCSVFRGKQYTENYITTALQPVRFEINVNFAF